jgi:hypothetical protein
MDCEDKKKWLNKGDLKKTSTKQTHQVKIENTFNDTSYVENIKT